MRNRRSDSRPSGSAYEDQEKVNKTRLMIIFLSTELYRLSMNAILSLINYCNSVPK